MSWYGSRIAPLSHTGRLSMILGVIGALACSGPDRARVAPPPARRALVVKKVAPADFGREARRPRQALIPGTDAQGRSTALPLLGRHNEVRVEAIWSRGTERGLAPVWLTTALPRAQLGLHEPQGEAQATPPDAPQAASGGAAEPIWRAAVETAWLAAASALNKDMADISVTARSDSPHHDVSASALLAAGFLASLTGRAVDPAATVIGVVNPDGTLGPVRDMAARIELAAREGKRVGYAAGTRAGEVAAAARGPGVEARALGDVGDAYALLTGGELPAPVLAVERDMRLSPAEVAHLEAGYRAWRALVSQRWASVVELTGAGKLPGALTRLARAARSEATAAEALWQEQELALAHDRMVRAAMLVTATVAIWQVIERVQAGDMAGAGQRLGELVAAPPPGGDAGEPVQTALRAVAGFEPSSLADHLLLIAATQSALRGHALTAALAAEIEGARAYLDALAEREQDGEATQERLAGQKRGPTGKARAAQREAERIDGVIARIAPLMLLRARAEIESKVAVQMLAARPGGPAHALTTASVRRLAREYADVAAADLGAFEALFEPPAAGAPGVPDGAERVHLPREPRYLLAREVVAWPQPELWRELSPRRDEHAPALLLAGSVLAYFEASVLMSAWYALGVRADVATGLVEGVAPDVHLASLLARAERAARQHAFAARVATGSIPVQARVSYQVARRLAGEDGPDHGHAQSEGDQAARRLRALEMYWASSVTSRLALALARN